MFEIILKDIFNIKSKKQTAKKTYIVRLGNIFIDKNLQTMDN